MTAEKNRQQKRTVTLTKTKNEKKMDPKTQAKVNGLLDNGHALIMGEWRGCRVDEVKYTDKKTGQAKSFIKAAHVIEVGQGTKIESIQVEQMLEDGTALTWMPADLKKGDLAIVIIRSVENDFGSRKISASEVAKA